MSFNSSRSPNSLCISTSLNFSNSTSIPNQVTLAACVVTALLTPITVAANGFILAAIWRNPSLRTPSYVLLAGLAFTDFCTGLLSQPFFVGIRIGGEMVKRKTYCIAGLVADSIGYYFSTLTVFVITMTAVERWLHMSRRSLLTVRRVVILYILFAVFLLLMAPVAWYSRYQRQKALTVVYLLLGAFCVVVTAFAYFKVFQIIRHHQNQVQTNENAIDIEKYKRSIFTILYILAVFVLSYVPYICVFLVFQAISNYGASYYTSMSVCSAFVFSSSFFNPLLYYCRLKEIRDSVKSIIRNLLSKLNGEES